MRRMRPPGDDVRRERQRAGEQEAKPRERQPTRPSGEASDASDYGRLAFYSARLAVLDVGRSRLRKRAGRDPQARRKPAEPRGRDSAVKVVV